MISIIFCNINVIGKKYLYSHVEIYEKVLNFHPQIENLQEVTYTVYQFSQFNFD